MFNKSDTNPKFAAPSFTPSAVPPTNDAAPKPAPRRKKTPPSGGSPMPTVVEEKPRRNSYHGEDSLKLYDLAVIATPPSKVSETQPVAKPRRNIKGTSDLTAGSGGSGRVQVYSKDAKNSHTIGPPQVWPTACGSPGFEIVNLDVHESLAIQYIDRPMLHLSEVNRETLPRVGSPTSDTPTTIDLPSGFEFKTSEQDEQVDVSKKTRPSKPPRGQPRVIEHNGPPSPVLPLPHSGNAIYKSRSSDDLSKIKKKKERGGLLGFIKKKTKSSRNPGDMPADDEFDAVIVTVDRKVDYDQESMYSQVGTIDSYHKPPLFRCKTAKAIQEFFKTNTSPDLTVRDSKGDTILHYLLKKNRPEKNGMLLTILESGHGYDINALDADDNTPLHIAAENNDAKYARILLAFGADPNISNLQLQYPHDIATDMKLKIDLGRLKRSVDNDIIELSSLPQEFSSLALQDKKNERLGHLMTPSNMTVLARIMDATIAEMEREKHDVQAFFSMSNYASDEQKDCDMAMNFQQRYLLRWKTTTGSRILFLDGGGIRGLIQIEILMEIERRTGRKITELFDWIVGTSTGGIVALGLVYGKKSLQQLRDLYFEIKSKVFGGSTVASVFYGIPQKSTNMDEVLKKELGDAPLSSIETPRVMICTVNRKEIPLRVEFFNNFTTTIPHLKHLTEVPVWSAGRATSAAPMFFTPHLGQYVDGGVKANNPCDFAMTFINDYDRLMDLPERHFAMAVSIGTGIFPSKTLGDGSEWKGFSVMKQVNYVKEMVEMLTAAIGESEPVAKKFSVWCSKLKIPIPVFRFNPKLDSDISPGEVDDDKLIDMMIQTKFYIKDDECSVTMQKLLQKFKQLSKEPAQ